MRLSASILRVTGVAEAKGRPHKSNAPIIKGVSDPLFSKRLAQFPADTTTFLRFKLVYKYLL